MNIPHHKSLDEVRAEGARRRALADARARRLWLLRRRWSWRMALGSGLFVLLYAGIPSLPAGDITWRWRLASALVGTACGWLISWCDREEFSAGCLLGSAMGGMYLVGIYLGEQDRGLFSIAAFSYCLIGSLLGLSVRLRETNLCAALNEVEPVLRNPEP